MAFLCGFSLLFIIYTYAGYPCLLFIWSKLLLKKIDKVYLFPEPFVSVVIAVRNEEKHIHAKLRNLFKQNYPPEKMEIIIISDGSVDKTNEIINAFNYDKSDKISCNNKIGKKLKLIELDESRGKPNALNIGVEQATGEYIIFTDARQEFEPDVIRELVANFNDPSVGCVSGELVFYENSNSAIKAEMGFYWNLEKRIRKFESAIDSVAGATGAIYAIKKSLFRVLPEQTLLDDVYIPMQIVFQGYRNIFESKAVAYDFVSKDLFHEKKRKIRTLIGNYQLLQLLPNLLNPILNPIFFRYLSHKILRLFVPFFFLSFLLSSFVADWIIYKLILIFTIILFLIPFIERKFPNAHYISKISNMVRTFVSLNYFAFLAFIQFISPSKKKIW